MSNERIWTSCSKFTILDEAIDVYIMVILHHAYEFREELKKRPQIKYRSYEINALEAVSGNNRSSALKPEKNRN